jgi:preprotein translocase subunit YajC
MFGLAFAMAPPAGGQQGSGGGFGFFVPFILMFVIIYFLMIRPQQKKAKEHKALLDGLKKGDQVITVAGIHGKITSIDDTTVTLEVATGVNIKLTKGYIASLLNKE